MFLFCIMVFLVFAGLGAMFQNMDGHDTNAYRGLNGMRRSRTTGQIISGSSGGKYERWSDYCYMVMVGALVMLVVVIVFALAPAFIQ